MKKHAHHSSLILFALLALAAPAAAQDKPGDKPGDKATAVEAEGHFKKAVQLYNEANYRGALVEFKRAHDLAPRVSVLYNIGQTYQQLQDYAAAMRTFERYLAQGGGPHSSEVEAAIGVLKSRVGKVDVSTEGRACDVAVDDESAGKTPLSEPLIVSVGRHRVAVTCPGVAPASRSVDVVSGETAPVSFTFEGAPKQAPSHDQAGASPAATPAPPTSRPAYGTYAWISLGAGVALGAVGTVLYAMGASDHSAITGAPNYDKPGQVVGLTEQHASDLRSSGTAKKTMGAVLWGVGGAALATSIVLFTVNGSSKESTVAVGVAPTAGGAGATFSGHF